VTYDKNISPVDWYMGAYLLRFMELGDPTRNDLERRFLSWENTVLVRASSFDEAFEKVAAVGKKERDSLSRRAEWGTGEVAVPWRHGTAANLRRD
jgi:hypothetical protein